MRLYVLLLAPLLLSGTIHAQTTTFEKNVNYAARDLKQYFNKDGDSLILKSTKIIRQVDIFNEDFTRTLSVDARETRIDLSDLPLGEFVVQARLDRRWIVMYIVKTNGSNEDLNKYNVRTTEVTTETTRFNRDSVP